MKAKGNGLPETCASNLLQIIRGEVAYDRVRGIDARLIDKPNSADDLTADMEWLLETYEPRVTVTEAETDSDALMTGDFSTLIKIERKEADEDE